MLETFWNATFIPDLDAKEGNWDSGFFGPIDIFKAEFNAKESSLKEVAFMVRPHCKVFRKRSEMVQIWTTFLHKSIQVFQSEAQFDTAFQIMLFALSFWT